MEFVLGIDIGGSKVLCGVVASDGTILRTHAEPRAKDDGIDGMMAVIRRCADRVLRDEAVTAVGATIPALADAKRGLWLYAPFSKLANIPIADMLQDEFKLPAAIDNDVNACAVAELKFGRCRGVDNFVWATVSNGVGGAIVINGALYYGSTGTAGEFGHVCVEDDPAEVLQCCCGKWGCTEAMTAGPGMVKRYGEAGVSAKEIGARAKRGEAKAIAVYRRTGVYLGRAAAMCVDLPNPSAVIFGGGISMDFDLFSDTLHETCANRVFTEANKNYLLAPTALGYDAALLGAACLAMQIKN